MAQWLRRLGWRSWPSPRVPSHFIIARRRSNIAHLHRPWRATVRQSALQAPRAFVSTLSLAMLQRRAVLQRPSDSPPEAWQNGRLAFGRSKQLRISAGDAVRQRSLSRNNRNSMSTSPNGAIAHTGLCAVCCFPGPSVGGSHCAPTSHVRRRASASCDAHRPTCRSENNCAAERYAPRTPTEEKSQGVTSVLATRNPVPSSLSVVGHARR
jgi:hypothetical protein